MKEKVLVSNHTVVGIAILLIAVTASIYFTLQWKGKNLMTYVPGAVAFYYLVKIFSRHTAKSVKISSTNLEVWKYVKPFKVEKHYYEIKNLERQKKLKGFSRSGGQWFKTIVYDRSTDEYFQLYSEMFLWNERDIKVIEDLLPTPNE